jgi:hypothetical protein
MSGADCPASAPGCLEFTTPGVGFCSQQCVTDGALTTDGGAGISSITPDPLADAQLGICTAIYSGAIGQAACGAIYQYSPMDAQLQPSSTYSGVSIACSIVCDESQRCPGTLQCNTILDRCEP